MIRIAKHTVRFTRVDDDGEKKIITVKAGDQFDFTIDELRALNKAQPGVTKKLFGVVDNERPLPAGTPVVGDAQEGPEDSTKQRRNAPKPTLAVGTKVDDGGIVELAKEVVKDIEDEL